MKKLILLFLVLPFLAKAQTNTAPQFKRNIPPDSLLGYSIPGITGNHWLPDTAWVKKYGSVNANSLFVSKSGNNTLTGTNIFNQETFFNKGTGNYSMFSNDNVAFLGTGNEFGASIMLGNLTVDPGYHIVLQSQADNGFNMNISHNADDNVYTPRMVLGQGGSYYALAFTHNNIYRGQVSTGDLSTKDSVVFSSQIPGLSVNISPLPISLNAQSGFNARSFIQGNITSFKGYQYAIWVSDSNVAVIGKRNLTNGSWQTFSLGTLMGVQQADEHNCYSIAIDTSGYIHVVGNQHNNTLNYIKSTNPQDITAWSSATMIGTEENSVTYPRFFKKKDGTLFFYYRNGVSGSGNSYLNKYNVSTGWTRQSEITDGIDDADNFYENHIEFDKNGKLWISGLWRTSTSPATNQDVCLFTSVDDGVTFQNTAGTTYSLPIRIGTSTPFLAVGPNVSLINQVGSAVDSLGRYFVVNTYLDGSGNTNLYQSTLTGTTWSNRWITTWTSGAWNLSGVLANGQILRPSIFSYQGSTYCVYAQTFDPKTEQSGLRIIDITPEHTLKEVGLITNNLAKYEPTYDDEDIANGNLTMLITKIPADSIPAQDRYKGLIYTLKINTLPSYFSNSIDINDLSLPLDYVTQAGSVTKEDLLQGVVMGGDGVTPIDPGAISESYQATQLGTTLGNYQLINTVQQISATNLLKLRTWAYRNANGTSFTTVTFHTGIGVDSSFPTPYTDKTWMDLNPNAGSFAWGNAGSTYFSLSSTAAAFTPTATFAAGFTTNGFPYINGTAGNEHDIRFQTGAVDRWYFGVDGTAETGSNAGSNLILKSRTDAGGSLSALMYVVRSNGHFNWNSVTDLGYMFGIGGTFGVSGAVTLSNLSTAGLVANSSAGLLSTTTALPSGTTATTQTAADNSTKVATTAYVDRFLPIAVSNTTLVSGTKAITISGLTSSSHAFVQFVSGGGTLTTTFQYTAVCTTNTLTITAVTNGLLTNTLDTSTLNYTAYK